MHYANPSLDRADHLRKDDAALERMFNDSQTRFYPVHQGDSLIQSGDPSPASIAINKPSDLPISQAIFLGLDNTAACFAFSCSDHTTEQRQQILDQAPDNTDFINLRTIGPLLNNHEGSILAYAKALTSWHDRIKFCELCGSGLTTTAGGHVKKCTNTDCAHLQFPRTDPAVIMLVERAATTDTPAQCLLGRNRNWPEGVFSTLAGFVEPGESLESAVIREVYEESRIKTSNVRYLASQPWPFPRSIMLGFIATADSTDIQIDPHELEEAHWFSAEQLKEFGTWGDANDGLKLPRTDSIAYYLINHWLESL